MKIKRKLNRLYDLIKTSIGYLLFRATKKSKLKKIFIVSSPRGGSTWLGEVLSEADNCIFIDEPLFVDSHSKLKKVGIKWEIYRDINTKDSSLDHFFHELFCLDFFHWRALIKNKFIKFIATDKLVFKFINANLLLDYLSNRFDSEKFIYMIRNPYAVISSQLKHNGWNWAQNVKTMTIPDHLFELDCFKNLGFKEMHDLSVEEVLTFNWCLTNKPILTNPSNNKRWLTVAYENLISQNKSDFLRIADFVENKIDNTNIISSSTKGDAGNYIISGQQLNKWKSHLTEMQIFKINDILKRFECEVYSVETGMPFSNLIYNSK